MGADPICTLGGQSPDAGNGARRLDCFAEVIIGESEQETGLDGFDECYRIVKWSYHFPNGV